MHKIGIVGTSTWATTLGLISSRAGHETVLWARNPVEANRLELDRENSRFLPGFAFPESLSVTADREHAFGDADVVLIAVPSETMRTNLRAIYGSIGADALLLCATKGIEVTSGRRMSELITEELGVSRGRVGVLSGPNLAYEIAENKAASATVAFYEVAVAERAQEILNTTSFRLYTSTDVVGVELGGALKNIIAIGAGFIDGVGMGANLKAAFVTRGLHEITRFGVACGALPETFAGLSGIGDLIATCYSSLSRNYRLGQLLAGGSSLHTALESLGRTAEGVPTTRAAVKQAEALSVEMPIATVTMDVLDGRLNPEDAASHLLARKPQPEVRY